MRTTINNWTEACSVDVRWNRPHGEVPALITIGADCGPMRLHFSMTAEQAREMAAALLTYADEVDACQPVVTQ